MFGKKKMLLQIEEVTNMANTSKMIATGSAIGAGVASLVSIGSVVLGCRTRKIIEANNEIVREEIGKMNKNIDSNLSEMLTNIANSIVELTQVNKAVAGNNEKMSSSDDGEPV